jgi:hypothetical protein
LEGSGGSSAKNLRDAVQAFLFFSHSFHTAESNEGTFNELSREKIQHVSHSGFDEDIDIDKTKTKTNKSFYDYMKQFQTKCLKLILVVQSS